MLRIDSCLPIVDWPCASSETRREGERERERARKTHKKNKSIIRSVRMSTCIIHSDTVYFDEKATEERKRRIQCDRLLVLY